MLLHGLSLLRDDPWGFVKIFLATSLALVIAISIHEMCHAIAATSLGDDTAKRQGRLTLNPLAHLDPIGTILLFLVGFGWGKPVPVNPLNLKFGERRGMAIVGMAGPLSNLVLAAIFAIAIRLINGEAAEVLLQIFFINIILAVFNLIPIPPLDGFRVAIGILPRQLSFSFSKMELYGPMVLIGVLAVDSITGLGFLGRTISPVINLFSKLFIGVSLL
mgnify:CR=1 FL=1